MLSGWMMPRKCSCNFFYDVGHVLIKAIVSQLFCYDFGWWNNIKNNSKSQFELEWIIYANINRWYQYWVPFAQGWISRRCFDFSLLPETIDVEHKLIKPDRHTMRSKQPWACLWWETVRHFMLIGCKKGFLVLETTLLDGNLLCNIESL